MVSQPSTPRLIEMSQMEALAQIITNGVKDIEAKCAERGVSYPTPQDICDPESDAIQNSFSSQATPIIAAAQDADPSIVSRLISRTASSRS